VKDGAIISGMAAENIRLANSEERVLDQVWVKGAPYPHQGSCPIHTTIIPKGGREVKKKNNKKKLFLMRSQTIT
jgi:hypothetical protein